MMVSADNAPIISTWACLFFFRHWFSLLLHNQEALKRLYGQKQQNDSRTRWDFKFSRQQMWRLLSSETSPHTRWLVDRYQHYGDTCCFHLQGRINRQQTALKCWCPFPRQQFVTSENSNLHNEEVILSRTYILHLLIFPPWVI